MKAWMRDSAAGGGEAVSNFGNVSEVEVGGLDDGADVGIK